jgi:hypothetical protein
MQQNGATKSEPERSLSIISPHDVEKKRTG